MDPERWQTIKEVFNRVVDLPIEERSAILREACAGDETLKTEVLELLQYHDHGSLDLPENPHAVTSFVSGLTHEDVIGRQVGGYVIDREIGRGGMGSVYLAHRVDADFEQTVAIKLIKRGFDTDEIIGRFRHERRILAALDHPYITRLLDGGSTEDGRPYLVMEYVEGLPLTEYCDQKRLTVNERLELFLKVCSAVTYAHVNLVIHRDLKPSNILVTADGIPKLLDFGVAKLLMEPGTNTQRTADMSRAMTPAYASPEQILNNKMTITSDVYSLGVVLYELLVGRKPFNFESMRLDQVARVISQVPPPLPSLTLSRVESAERIASERSTTVERLKRKLRGDLDNIVLTAMKSEPERRYVSSYRLGGDIENYLKGLPVSAQKDSVSYRASKFIQRNKTGVLAGVGIGASIIFALASSARQARRAQRERDRAIREARKSAAINRFAHRMVTSADPTRRGKDVKFIDVIREAEAVLERDFEGQPEPMAELRTAIGLTYLSLGSFDWAEGQLRAALDLRLQIFDRKSAPVADSIRAVAKLLHAKGQLKEAEPLYLEALEIFEEVRGSETPKRASVMTDYAHLLALTGRHEEAIAYNREAIRIKKRVFGEDHPEVAISLAETGNVLAMSMSRFEDAEPYHREALRILKLHHKGDHPEVAKALLYLSAAVHERSLADAIAFASESLDMRKRVFGDVHPDVAWACYNVGYFLIKDGRADESLEYSKQVVEMVPKGLPREHTVVNSSYLLIGRGYLLKGAFENALEAFDECLALRKDTLPAGHWLLDTSESFRGYCMAKIGRLEEGLALMRSSHAGLAEKLGSDHDQAKEALERLREFESA